MRDNCPICNSNLTITRTTPICGNHRHSIFKLGVDLVRRENMRAIKLGLPGTLTLTQYHELSKWFYCDASQFTLVCAYCDEPYPRGLDHWHALSLGNGTTANNVVPCCLNCNMMKSVLPGEAFFAVLIERFKSPVAKKNLERALSYFESLRE